MLHAVLFLLPFCLFQESDDVKEGADALLGTVDLAEWDEWFQKEAPDIPFCPSEFVQGIVNMEETDDTQTIIDRVGRLLLPTAKTGCAKLILFTGIGILAGLLSGVSSDASVFEAATHAFRIAASCTVLTAAATEIQGAYGMLHTVSVLAERALPVLIGFLTLCGMEHSASAMLPLFTILSAWMIRVIETMVIPLGCIGGVLISFDTCANGRLASLGRLFLRAARTVLGVIGLGYGLFGTFRAAAAVNADGLMIRTAKLAAGSLPAVGGIVSESVETAYRCMLFVRNALGLGCAAMLLLACARPVLNVFVLRCAARASSALSEPISGKAYAELLHGISDLLHILMLSELAAAAMALTAISPVLGTFGIL